MEVLKKLSNLKQLIQKYNQLLDKVEDTDAYQTLTQKLSKLEVVIQQAEEQPTATATARTAKETKPLKKEIDASVGEGGVNNEDDVRVVQSLLEITPTGECDTATISAIKKLQLSIGFKKPDGRVDVGGGTWKALVDGSSVISEEELDELVDSPKVKALLSSVHNSEGGYVDDPDDAGGKTKYGIAEHYAWQTFAPMFGLDPKDTHLIKDITKEQADEYYIRTRLAPLSIQDINSTKVANALFDQSVLTPAIVKPSMRKALNDIDSNHNFQENSNDTFSSEEIAAINKADSNKLVKGFVKYQNIYYKSLDNEKYEKGWLNRTARLLDFEVEEQEQTTNDNEDTSDTTDTTDTTTTQVSSDLSASVGQGGKNKYKDVLLVQQLLNNTGASLAEDGAIGSNTIEAISTYQTDIGFSNPDGRVDPKGLTWEHLSKQKTEKEDNIWEAITGAADQVMDSIADTYNQAKDTVEDAVEGIAAGIMDTFSDEKDSYKYYSHPDWESVKVTYGSHAKKLNATAERLLKSILAKAGMSAGHLSSTLRTYADQARINYEQNTGKQIRKWYGENVYQVWSQYKKQGKSTADYAAYLEKRDKENGSLISNHIPGYALDVSPHDQRFSDQCKELKPITGSGVRTYLVEKGCTHLEFTFKVT